MTDLAACVSRLEKFTDGDLRVRLREIEKGLVQCDGAACADLNLQLDVGSGLLQAAAAVKRAAAQIDALIHAVGVLHLLPTLLKDGESVQYLSLGAGNTGKAFDLETNLQVAEFTFIAWRGGSEAVRQSKLFVDFVHLAEATTTKERKLYVLGLHHPAKFLKSRRTLASVLSRRPDELRLIMEHYGDSVRLVGDYCALHSDRVNLLDMQSAMPPSLLAAVEAAEG